MGWDKNISFENAMTIITRKMRACEAKSLRCYGYSAILLIQLLNGARISEAVRGIKEWVDTENTIIEVLVSKKQGRNITRKIIIPRNLNLNKGLILQVIDDDDKMINRTKRFAKQELGINTHSLRYAFINHMAKMVGADAVAKFIHHSSLDMLQHYIRQSESDEALARVINDLI
jgi:integrase